MYFSEHPATNPNWNFVWLNIISLLIAVLFWIKSAEKVVHIYHFINFAALTLFLFFWWLIPQQLPVASIPISVCLGGKSGVNMLLIRKEKRKQKKYTSAKYLKAGWGQ